MGSLPLLYPYELVNSLFREANKEDVDMRAAYAACGPFREGLRRHITGLKTPSCMTWRPFVPGELSIGLCRNRIYEVDLRYQRRHLLQTFLPSFRLRQQGSKFCLAAHTHALLAHWSSNLLSIRLTELLQLGHARIA